MSQHLLQTDTQLREGSNPIRQCHPDQTTINHTLHHHAELLAFYQLFESNKQQSQFCITRKNRNYLVQRIDGGGQTTMDTKDSIVNNGRQTEKVKNFATVSPHIDRTKFAKTLVIESIDLCDLTRFMIATYQCDPVRVPHLQVDSAHSLQL